MQLASCRSRWSDVRTAGAATGRASPSGTPRSPGGRPSGCPSAAITAAASPDGLARSTAGRPAPPRWRRHASASRPRRRGRSGARRTTPSTTSRAIADRHAGDVVEAALRDLVERGHRRQRQRDAGRPDQLARAATRLPVAGEVVGERHLRSPSREASTSVASSASSAGGVSPIGEAVPRLPPIVAPLRISRDANCGNSWREQRHPPGEPSLDLGEGQRGADLDDVVGRTSNVRSSGEPVDRDDEGRPRRRGG